MKKHFKLRGYNEIDLTRTISEVQKMKREELLKDKSREINGRGRVFVCTWHPSLKTIPATLSRNHDILLNDPKLKSIFEEKSSVAYRRRKNIGNFLCKNDVRMLEKKEPTKCKGCKLCKIINNEDILINKNNGAQVRTKKGGHCQSTGVIYAVTCIKCQQIYVGHTGETMAKRWSKHKYDIRNRPDQNELATHCHHDHDIEKDLRVTILDHGHDTLGDRIRLEDRYICKLQTLQLNKGGMNIEMHSYAKEVYSLWRSIQSKNASLSMTH